MIQHLQSLIISQDNRDMLQENLPWVSPFEDNDSVINFLQSLPSVKKFYFTHLCGVLVPMRIPRGVWVGVGVSMVKGYILVLRGVDGVPGVAGMERRAARRAEPGVVVAEHGYGELLVNRFLRLVGTFSFWKQIHGNLIYVMIFILFKCSPAIIMIIWAIMQ